MNFNIALNTIIYIMVFLFPGVLFRKFYFSGRFTKQFGQGNLLERFLFTLLCSIVCLVLCGIIFYIINVEYKLDLLHDISFDGISNVFSTLATNKYPIEFEDNCKLLQLGILLLVIYIFSGFLGFILLKIIRFTSFDLFMSTLRFNNEWQYLAQPTKENGVKIKFGDEYVTYVDILIQHKDREDLYKGKYQDFIVDKDSKIEYIILSNAIKFIPIERKEENNSKIESLEDLTKNDSANYSLHTDFKDKIVFKKRVQGERFVIAAGNVSNINFTYLKIQNRILDIKLTTLKITLACLYLGIILLVALPSIDLPGLVFSTLPKKLFFSLFTFFSLITIYSIIKDLIFRPQDLWDKSLNNLGELGFYIFPYIWIFGYIDGEYVFIGWVIYILILSLFAKKENRQDNNSSEINNDN